MNTNPLIKNLIFKCHLRSKLHQKKRLPHQPNQLLLRNRLPLQLQRRLKKLQRLIKKIMRKRQKVSFRPRT